MEHFSIRKISLSAVLRRALMASAIVAVAGAFAAPARADEDDWGDGHRGWQRHEQREEWREQQWRQHEWQEEHERQEQAWRQHEWREHQPYAYVVPGYSYAPPVVYGPPRGSVDLIFPIHIR